MVGAMGDGWTPGVEETKAPALEEALGRGAATAGVMGAGAARFKRGMAAGARTGCAATAAEAEAGVVEAGAGTDACVRFCVGAAALGTPLALADLAATASWMACSTGGSTVLSALRGGGG